MALFALTFPAIGAGFVAGGMIAKKIAKKENELRAQHPDQPWRWKSEWVEDSIPSNHRYIKKALYGYTIWSALVIMPLIIVAAISGSFQSDEKSYLLLGFVVFWSIPAWLSFRHLQLRLVVGSLRFQMTPIPACPDGVVNGYMIFEKPAKCSDNARVTLTCRKEITTKGGDGDSTATEIIWSHTQSLPLRPSATDDAYKIPVSIALPPDAPQSGASIDPEISHSWKLEFKLPGTVLHAEFEIPVFQPEHQDPHLSQPVTAETSIHERANLNLPALLAARHIHADFDSNGILTAISCLAARHRGMIIFLIIFDLVWTGVAVYLCKSNAPLIFRLVWPISAAVLWVIIIYQLLHSRQVSLSRESLEICNKIGPFTRIHTFSKSDIKSFTYDSNMSFNNQKYYRVRMESMSGKKITLADAISESLTAAALASRFENWKKASLSF